MKGVFVCLLIAFAVAGVCYLSSGQLMMTGIVGLVYFLALLSLAYPKVSTMHRKRRIRKECYRFMNSFVTTCSVTSSLSRAYEVSCEGSEGEEKEVMDACSCNDVEGRIHELSSYFENQLYDVFLSIVSIYEERGGDILTLSSSLLEEATRIEEEAENRVKLSRGRLFQYMTLWAMSLGIVAFLRFALSNFYDQLMASSTYMICLASYFGLVLFGLLIYCQIYTGEKRFSKPKKRGKK